VDVVGAMSFKTGVIVFWSPKGGVGKTSLAFETSVLLSQLGGRRVLLVDANMNAGHIALRLGLYEETEKNNIAHLASDYLIQKNRITAQMLAQRVVKADRHLDQQTKIVQNRLDLLLGIPNSELAGGDQLRGKQGRQFMIDLLQLAREQYEYVVVDNGSSTAIGAHLGVLTAADLVLFVTNDDIASITDGRITLDLLQDDKYSLNRDKFKVIVNQYDAQLSNIDLRTIAQYLRMPIFASVPDDTTRSFRNTGNLHKSFALSYLNIRKNSPQVEATMRGLFQIAEGIFPPLSPIIAARDKQLDGQKKNGGWLGRLFEKK
jgi:pilus assembly protein CpaE